jgi:hypothetical protein
MGRDPKSQNVFVSGAILYLAIPLVDVSCEEFLRRARNQLYSDWPEFSKSLVASHCFFRNICPSDSDALIFAPRFSEGVSSEGKRG